MPQIARALWITGPGKAEIRNVDIEEPGLDMAEVRSVAGAISRGTERLVFEGRIPNSEWDCMRAPHQEGDFPFPVKYGYQTVGVVENGPASLIGQTVFALFPHQTRFTAPVANLVPVPANVSAQRAVLAANMETALNALWDGGAGPGDRIAVIGAGQIGFLTAYLLNKIPGTEVTLIDIAEGAAERADQFGIPYADGQRNRSLLPADCDLVFHASATEEGLRSAIQLAGIEATIVEMSWYGDRQVTIPLGGAFHSKRLKLISSQVGQIAPSHRPRWDHGRRLRAAMSLLGDEKLDALLSTPCKFDDLPEKLPYILAERGDGLVPVIDYS